MVGLWSGWLEHDATRVAAVGLALVASLMLLPAAKDVPGWPRGLVLGLVLAALGRAALAPYPDAALREVAVLLGMVAWAALLGRTLTLHDIVRALALAGTVYAVSMLLLLWVAVAVPEVAAMQRAGQIGFFGYTNFRFFNHVQTVALPLTLGVAALDPNPRWRWLARLGAAAGFALLFQAWGRATGLAVVMATAAVVLLGHAAGSELAVRARRWATEAVAAAAVGAAIVMALWLLHGGLSGQVSGSREVANLERLDLVRFALARSFEAPLLGIGPMHLSGMFGMNAAHPHNVWAQAVAEWGWPATLALLGAGAVAAWRMWKELRNQPDREAAWGLVLLATGLAVVVDSLFSGNFVMPMSQLWIASLGGCALAWWRHLARRSSPPVPWLGRPAVLLLILVQVWLITSILPEVRRWPQPLEDTIQRYPNEVLNPRFWSHGWFGPPGPRP